MKKNRPFEYPDYFARFYDLIYHKLRDGVDNQLINIEFQFEWDEDDGKRTEIWISPLRFFFRYELEHLIERTEFKSYQIFGDYKGNELGSDSKEFVVICRKGEDER